MRQAEPSADFKFRDIVAVEVLQELDFLEAKLEMQKLNELESDSDG